MDNDFNRINLDKIPGRAYGNNGGGSFDDSNIFTDQSSIASDFTPSEYHVTYCANNGLSIQFTYETTLHNGSKISKKAPRHGAERTCSSHTIFLRGNAITKVTVVTRHFTSEHGPSIRAIAGIQFFTNGWESPFYGDKVDSISTEMSSSHRLGYLVGRHGYLIDQLQLVWIRPQTYAREYSV